MDAHAATLAAAAAVASPEADDHAFQPGARRASAPGSAARRTSHTAPTAPSSSSDTTATASAATAAANAAAAARRRRRSSADAYDGPAGDDTPGRHFVCHECGRSFARLLHLQRHEYRHVDYRPFQCPCCSKTFSRYDSLVRHARLHKDTLPEGSLAAGQLRKHNKACMSCTETTKCQRCAKFARRTPGAKAARKAAAAAAAAAATATASLSPSPPAAAMGASAGLAVKDFDCASSSDTSSPAPSDAPAAVSCSSLWPSSSLPPPPLLPASSSPDAASDNQDLAGSPAPTAAALFQSDTHSHGAGSMHTAVQLPAPLNASLLQSLAEFSPSSSSSSPPPAGPSPFSGPSRYDAHAMQATYAHRSLYHMPSTSPLASERPRPSFSSSSTTTAVADHVPALSPASHSSSDDALPFPPSPVNSASTSASVSAVAAAHKPPSLTAPLDAAHLPPAGLFHQPSEIVDWSPLSAAKYHDTAVSMSPATANANADAGARAHALLDPAALAEQGILAETYMQMQMQMATIRSFMHDNMVAYLSRRLPPAAFSPMPMSLNESPASASGPASASAIPALHAANTTVPTATTVAAEFPPAWDFSFGTADAAAVTAPSAPRDPLHAPHEPLVMPYTTTGRGDELRAIAMGVSAEPGGAGGDASLSQLDDLGFFCHQDACGDAGGPSPSPLPTAAAAAAAAAMPSAAPAMLDPNDVFTLDGLVS